MDVATIHAVRALLEEQERHREEGPRLYAHEPEFLQQPLGVSVLIAVHDGAGEMAGLLHSLINQSLSRSRFEVIFSLNGCRDASAAEIHSALVGTDLDVQLLESERAGISYARNRALAQARFRYATFVDHDDLLSRPYLEQLLALGDYRSVVVSNIQRVEDGRVGPDYAQRVIREGFAVSLVHGPADIDLCHRAYTLNAIKMAPTYMLRRIRYDESLPHCEDVAYWRDVFHAFLPITVKSPGWSDVYYRTIRPRSASRAQPDQAAWAEPRLAILRRIAAESERHGPLSPQRSFDRSLAEQLRQTLAERGL